MTEIPSGTVDSYEWAILEENGYDLITTVVTVGPTLTRSLPYPGEVQRVRVRGRDTDVPTSPLTPLRGGEGNLHPGRGCCGPAVVVR